MNDHTRSVAHHGIASVEWRLDYVGAHSERRANLDRLLRLVEAAAVIGASTALAAAANTSTDFEYARY